MANTKQAALDLAKKVARRAAAEPMEILKTAGEQVIGTPERTNEEQKPTSNDSVNPELAKREQKVKQKDSSLLRALESEIKDIQKQDVISMLQTKIANGEPVYLENYPGLTPEQRQMLENQIKMVAYQKEQQKLVQMESLPQVTSKQSRKMGGPTQKQAADREQKRVEKPVPPSG